MFLRPNSESYQLSCCTTTLVSLQLPLFLAAFVYLLCSPSSSHIQQEKYRRLQPHHAEHHHLLKKKAKENFQLDKSLFSKRLCSFMVTDLNLSSGGIPSERTSNGARGGSRPKLRVSKEGRPLALPTSKLNLVA